MTIQAQMDALIVRGKHVRELVDAADARRADRADRQIDVDEVLAGTDGLIRSTVQSSEGNRQYNVVITPVTAQGDRYDWRWACTCPDASKGVHGPCKHTIAVAEHWLDEQARPQFRFLRSLLAVEDGPDEA
ncbi:SWIM zinc finger domain-containing protein [Deltaproteobacteria bacterium]|nr:SWIM zinc finger domain-containing protein [Deltaproteobacteria bacterium]